MNVRAGFCFHKPSEPKSDLRYSASSKSPYSSLLLSLVCMNTLVGSMDAHFFKQVGWCFLEKRTSRIHLQIFVTFFLEAHIAVTMFVSAPPLINSPLLIFIMHHDQYATATFKVLDAYAGWEGINYVMNNVRNPVQTLKIAGPLGLGICAVLYMLANIAYFACVFPRHLFYMPTFFRNTEARQRIRYASPASPLQFYS